MNKCHKITVSVLCLFLIIFMTSINSTVSAETNKETTISRALHTNSLFSDYSWQAVSSPTTQNLVKIDMISADDGWAVGDNGTILQWDGSVWQVAASSTQYHLRNIFMLSPTDGWIVGGGLNSTSIILHWDGIIWQEVACPVSNMILTGIYMISSTDGWAVGGDPNNLNKIILHWNGSSWSIVPGPGIFLHDVFMLSSIDGWAVGEAGTFLHWDGIVWTNNPTPTNYSVNAIDMISPTDGWAVGGANGDWIYGEAYHWDGESWQSVSPRTSRSLMDISIVSINNYWAVSYSGHQILNWNNDNWVITPVQTNLSGIDMLSTTDGWAVGTGGLILHYTSSNEKVFLPLIIK